MTTSRAFLIILLTVGLTGYYFYKNKAVVEAAVPVTTYNVRTGATYTTYAGDVGNPEMHTPLAPGGVKRHRVTPERFGPKDAPMGSRGVAQWAKWALAPRRGGVGVWRYLLCAHVSEICSKSIPHTTRNFQNTYYMIV